MPNPATIHEASGIFDCVLNLSNPFDDCVVSECWFDLTLRWADLDMYLEQRRYTGDNIAMAVNGVLLSPFDFEAFHLESWRIKLRLNCVGLPRLVLAFHDELVRLHGSKVCTTHFYNVMDGPDALLSYSIFRDICTARSSWKSPNKTLPDTKKTNLFFVVEGLAVTCKDHRDYPVKRLHQKAATAAIAAR